MTLAPSPPNITPPSRAFRVYTPSPTALSTDALFRRASTTRPMSGEKCSGSCLEYMKRCQPSFMQGRETVFVSGVEKGRSGLVDVILVAWIGLGSFACSRKGTGMVSRVDAQLVPGRSLSMVANQAHKGEIYFRDSPPSPPRLCALR